MINPWLKLPYKAPFILPEDSELIQDHKNFLGLRLDTLPEPVVGGLDDAKIVFLALNPGFTQDDVDVNLKLERFIQGNRQNLIDPYGSDNYYFAGGLEGTGGYKWWTSKLKPIINEGIELNTLKQKVMVIEFFPYHSVNYKHMNITLPSQLFSFELVREAVRRKKIIVIMRSKKLWVESVPELRSYPFLTLNSPQNVIVSPKNIGSSNFEAILPELRSK